MTKPLLLDETGNIVSTEKHVVFAYDFDKVCDLRGFDTLSFDIYSREKEAFTVRALIYPLKIARPEFIDSTEAVVTVCGEARRHIEIGFELFDYRKMVGAFWKYISAIKIIVESKDASIKDVMFKNRGLIQMFAKCHSISCDQNESAEYTVIIGNTSCEPSAIRLTQSKYARECLRTEIIPPELTIEAGESAIVKIIVHMNERIAPGGYEKHLILATPNGDSNHQRELELITVRKRSHPYLLHTEEGWRQVTEKTAHPWAERAVRDYVNRAEKWVVPEAAAGTYVFNAYSQTELRTAVVAWKLTGRKEFGEKAALYLKRLSSPEKGYLSTQQPYFVFIESQDEYSKGNPKEHRACSAGWVQEAEFFIQAAVAYDLLHDTDFLSKEDHQNIKATFISFIEFMDWLLTDGDGNNFQLAEAVAGLYCAMALQDYHWINRFLSGLNGLADLISSVILDDGLYFELATSYMKLGMSFMLEAATACENWGINLKSAYFPAAYDRNILHSPWAMKEKPFLGMSFERFGDNCVNYRSIEQCLDTLLRLLNSDGVLFSCNDGREKSFCELYELAYFLYRKPEYAAVVKAGATRELLYGVVELPDTADISFSASACFDNAGFAVLRCQNSSSDNLIQAVLKYGTHGGYHGHFDRISLLSVMKNGESFFNCLSAWYGYDSFLFKMWVQTSLAHNMTVVDMKMQRPAECKRILFHTGKLFSACATETYTEWSDPPYGGQTPYPLSFPEEKCAKEGRYILPVAHSNGHDDNTGAGSATPESRRQGDIGEYTEPVFQRRLIIATEDYVLAVDYLNCLDCHTFDCLYHPEGVYNFAGKAPLYTGYADRLDENPFGSGQFINNCYNFDAEAPLKISFDNDGKHERHPDAMRGMSHVNIFLAYPNDCGLIIAKYPESSDTFKPEDITNKDINSISNRKTVIFRQHGNEARFITALEPFSFESVVENIKCIDFSNIVVTLKNGTEHRILLSDMDSVRIPSVKFDVAVSGEIVESEIILKNEKRG